MQVNHINNILVRRTNDGNSFPGLIVEIPETNESSIIFYQTEMISRNLSKMVYDMNLTLLEQHLTIMYDIDFKVPLAEFLKGKQLEKHELIMISRNIIRIILMSERYFLNPDNFLLNCETVFINPDSLEVSLVYIPIDFNEGNSNASIEYGKIASEDICELMGLLLITAKDTTDLIETLNLKGLSLSDMLQKLNIISLLPRPDKMIHTGTDKQIKIRQETRQNINQESNHEKILSGIKQIFKADMTREFYNKNKLLIFLTYGLSGLILAGINTLIVKILVR